MLDGHWRSHFDRRLRPVGSNLHRTGINADHLTLAGIVLACGAAVAIALGALRGGMLLLLAAALIDVLDGAVAKSSGTASARGAFFDSVADRVTDSLLLFGVAWHLASTASDPHVALLPMAVLAASTLVSYQRAKAESLGLAARGGLMERAERLIVLGAGLVFEALLVPVLWVLLGLTVLTVGQRFVKVWGQAAAPVRPVPPVRWRTRRVARPANRTWRRRSRLHRR